MRLRRIWCEKIHVEVARKVPLVRRFHLYIIVVQYNIIQHNTRIGVAGSYSSALLQVVKESGCKGTGGIEGRVMFFVLFYSLISRLRPMIL